MKIIGSTANVVGYGHLGDGNLHLNISVPQYDNTVISLFLIEDFSCVCEGCSFPNKYQILQILAQIEPFVYEWTSKHHGSISAEHGLGLMKADKIYYSKSLETVSLIDCLSWNLY